MATKSIIKNIEISDPAEAEKLVKALEEAKKICDGAHFCVEGCETCNDNEDCDFRESEEGMERLTRKGGLVHYATYMYIKTKKSDESRLQKIVNALGKYEDTGLTPEQIQNLQQETDRLEHSINNHIKWNEAHTKARVEQGELIKDLKKQLQQYDADRIMEQQNCGELCKEAIELQQQIEAQQQEIDQLKDQNDTLSDTVNMFAPYIIGKKEAEVVEDLKELLTLKQQNAVLTADKDEQAGRIMRMEELLIQAKHLMRNTERYLNSVMEVALLLTNIDVILGSGAKENHICNTTKLPCAGCNPCCEHRKGE